MHRNDAVTTEAKTSHTNTQNGERESSAHSRSHSQRGIAAFLKSKTYSTTKHVENFYFRLQNPCTHIAPMCRDAQFKTNTG